MATTVLIVDDALFIRKTLRDLLEEAGYQVVAEAADGAQALEKYREFRPDLTTLDLVMPVKGGLEALQEIMAFDPAARVVICSAIGQETLSQAAHAAGARAFILKPFDQGLVLNVLREVMQG